MPRLWLALALAVGFASFSGTVLAQAVKRDDLKPGLVFVAADAPPTPGTYTRLDPTVALTLGAKQSTHPQSTGGSTFRWNGYINIITPGKYRFDATILGQLAVTIDGKEVFAGTVEGAEAKLVEGKELTLEAGIQPFEAVLIRKGEAVRTELFWRGPSFRSEPIPHFFFGHLPKQRPATFTAESAREHGRYLFEELSCVRCHKPAEGDRMAATLAERTGPNLAEIGKRAYPGWLDAWLANPKKLRPHTTMPSMFADTEVGAAERYATVAYLTSLGGPLANSKPAAATNADKQSADRGAKLYITAGCAACHGDQLTKPPTKKKKDDEEDDKPTLKPEDWLHASGTSGPQSFYQLGAVGSKTRYEPLSRFLQDPLATNPHGRMPNMTLTANECIDIARFLSRATDESINTAMPAEPKTQAAVLAETVLAKPAEIQAFEKLKPAAQWVALGKTLFTTKGCVSCHATEATGKTSAPAGIPDLSAIQKAAGKGCTSDAPTPGKQPVYNLQPEQKTALTTFLTSGLTGAGSTSPTYAARAAFKRFNCLNCHSRDGEGGFDLALSDKMKSLESAQNADDVQPPRLTGVGHKMRSAWMKDVLMGAARARPWMTLRMPQYGKHNVEFLAEALPLLEGTTTDDTVGKAEYTAEKLDSGRTLAGKGGHGCISCHDISGVSGGGTRGPDLATTNKRVRYDWYVRWMHQPQRMAPGTKMPQAFIDGKALLDSIYAGNGDKQIEALWAYFSLGPGLPMPMGMEPPKGLIVAPANGRPEIMRTFIPDNAGTKGVAVAYPTGVNMVFDTQRARLSYTWSGNFLDMSPVWVSRGGNQARVIGQKFWSAPLGTPWGMTDSREPPDFAKQALDPAYGGNPADGKFYFGRMAVKSEGYVLDSSGIPTFRYQISPSDEKGVLKVAETPEPAKVTVAYGVTRKFALEVPASKTAWFHAADAKSAPRVETADNTKLDFAQNTEIETPAPGSRLIVPIEGEKVQVLQLTAAPPGTVWRMTKQKTGWEILVRLPENKEAAKVDMTLNLWVLPKDDEKLLQGLK